MAKGSRQASSQPRPKLQWRAPSVYPQASLAKGSDLAAAGCRTVKHIQTTMFDQVRRRPAALDATWTRLGVP